MWTKGIYQQHNLFFSLENGFKFTLFSFFLRVSRIDSVIPATLHPFNISSLPFKDSKSCHASFMMTLTWRDFKTESCTSTFIVVTSREGIFFQCFHIWRAKRYLLIDFFSIFFKLVLIVGSWWLQQILT